MDFQLGKCAHRSARASVVAHNKMWPKIAKNVFLADGARVIGDVELGENCSVWFNAIVRGDVGKIVVGEGTNIQDGAVIHCTFQKFSTTIGNNVSIGHMAVVHGATIEDGVLLGMHSTVMDGARVGAGSIVAAGALVPPGTVIPPKSLFVGLPGKVLRPLKDEEVEANRATCFRYVEYAAGYDFNKSS